MAQASFEHFEHGADIGVRGLGTTQAEAFEQAALALTAVVVEPGSVRPRLRVEFSCTAPDAELLLVDWLNAVIFEMAVRHVVFGRYEVDLSDNHLDAVAWGEPLDADRHEPRVELKGATLTCLSVGPDRQGRWIAQCVVDV